MAIVGEELGFIAMIIVIIMYLFLLAASFLIACNAIDREGLFMAFGIGISTGIHAIINLGVVSGFLPTTGITSPLISYGGSNMIVTWIGIGLLISICRISKHSTNHDDTSPNALGNQLEKLQSIKSIRLGMSS